MYCVTAVYTLKNNEKKIRVTNSGFVEAKKPKQKTSTGTAWLPNPLKPGELKVSFFRPFAGDYFIIYLDDDYQHVLVGSPDRNYLWILARTPQMNITDYNMLVNLAKQEGFKTDHLLKTKQDCKN